jgi:hypothetical protein
MRVKMASTQHDQSHLSQICALEYRPQGRTGASSPKGAIVLIVLKPEDGGMSFFVHPELSTIVRGGDLAYIEALLSDFLGRAKLDPDALFKQISSLGTEHRGLFIFPGASCGLEAPAGTCGSIPDPRLGND